MSTARAEIFNNDFGRRFTATRFVEEATPLAMSDAQAMALEKEILSIGTGEYGSGFRARPSPGSCRAMSSSTPLSQEKMKAASLRSSSAASSGLKGIAYSPKQKGSCGCGGGKPKAASAPPLAPQLPLASPPPEPPYVHVMANKATILEAHPELADAYAKAETFVKSNPNARPANLLRYYAPIIETLAKL